MSYDKGNIFIHLTATVSSSVSDRLFHAAVAAQMNETPDSS